MSRKIGLGDTHFDHDIDGEIDFDFFRDDSTAPVHLNGGPTTTGGNINQEVIIDSSETQVTDQFGEISIRHLNGERYNSNLRKPNQQQQQKPTTTTNPHLNESPKHNPLLSQDAIRNGTYPPSDYPASQKSENRFHRRIGSPDSDQIRTLSKKDDGGNDLTAPMPISTMTDAFSSKGVEGKSVGPEKSVPPAAVDEMETSLDAEVNAGSLKKRNNSARITADDDQAGVNVGGAVMMPPSRRNGVVVMPASNQISPPPPSSLLLPPTNFTEQLAGNLPAHQSVAGLEPSIQSPLFVEVDNDSASDLYSLSDTDEDDDDDDSLAGEFCQLRQTNSGCHLIDDDDNFDSDITDVSPLSSANMSPLPPQDPSPLHHRRPRSTSLPPGSDPTVVGSPSSSRVAMRPKSSSLGTGGYFRPARTLQGRADSDDSVSGSTDSADFPARSNQAVSGLARPRSYRNGAISGSANGFDATRRSDAVDLKVLSKAIFELEVERRMDAGSGRAGAGSGQRREGSESSDAAVNGTGSTCSSSAATSATSRLEHGSSVGSGSGRTCARPRRNMTFSNDEARRIDQDNKRLLRKIIDCHRPRKAHAPVTGRLASSAINRLKDMRKIESDNLALLKRLHSAKPTKELSRDYLMSTSTRRGPHAPSVPTSKSSGSLASTRTTSPFVTSGGGATGSANSSTTARGRAPHHSRSTGSLHSSSQSADGASSARSRQSCSISSGATSTAAPSIDDGDDEGSGPASPAAETPATATRER